MTTSNQTIFEITRDQIIKAALRKLGRLARGQSPDAQQLTDGQEALNAIVAEFTTLGMPLWARTDFTLPMVAGQSTYTLGVGQAVNTPFPIRIHGIVLRNSFGGVISMFPVARDDFNLLNVTSTGTPVNYTYQPLINYGVLKVWPTPDATVVSEYTAVITYQKPFQGFTAGTETPDFPQEWQNALIYALAVSLAPEYQIPLLDRQQLQKEAEIHLNTALSGGVEEASFFFQPDNMRGGG